MTEKKIQTESNIGTQMDQELPAIIGELSFIFLPFIVISIINLNKGSFTNLLQTVDWSLASSILFGQTIVKLIMGVASQEHSFEYQKNRVDNSSYCGSWINTICHSNCSIRN